MQDFCHATVIFARVRIPWEAFLKSVPTFKFWGCIFSCVFFYYYLCVPVFCFDFFCVFFVLYFLVVLFVDVVVCCCFFVNIL